MFKVCIPSESLRTLRLCPFLAFDVGDSEALRDLDLDFDLDLERDLDTERDRDRLPDLLRERERDFDDLEPLRERDLERLAADPERERLLTDLERRDPLRERLPL